MMRAEPRPPGPRTLSPVGSLLPFSRDPLGFLYRLALEHGDVAHFRAGRRDVYLLSHPDLIHEVLVSEARSFSKDRGLEMAKVLLGEGLLTSEGEKHARQRRLAQPSFHRDRLSAYAEIMSRRALEVTRRWHDGLEIDVGREMARLALRIVAEALFGEEVDDAAVATIGEALDDAMAEFTMARIPFHKVLTRLPLPSTLRLRRARARLDGVVDALVAARCAAPPAEGPNLLAALVGTRDEAGRGFTPSEVRDQVTTLLLAGHETTANALAWTFYLLARHPAEEERLRRELDAVLGSRPPALADLPRLVQAGRVLSESMRLYPPAWTVARRALRSFTARGYRIAAGSTVMMSQWVMHHHPAWFQDPFRFDPDRWTDERRAAQPRFSYFPFGGGPRVCIGEGFAWNEALLVLATVAQRFRLAPCDLAEVPPVARVTLRPARPIRAVVRLPIRAPGWVAPGCHTHGDPPN